MTFAAASVRCWKIDSGISGCFARVSITRNAPISTTAAASRPSVWPDVQPASLPLTIAYTAATSAAVTVIAPATSTLSRSASSSLPRQQPQRGQVHGDADRDVDEEDPVPAEHVGEDAAEQHADRPAARQHEAEDAHRLRALGGLGEHHHDQRQRDRRDDGAAEALDRAGDHEDLLRAGEPAGEGGDGEEGDTADEHSPVAEQVTEPAAEQQEAAEGEQVGVHDPGEGGLREAQIRPDRRQGDVHDRRVEDDHQISAAEHDECEPAGAVRQRRHRRFRLALRRHKPQSCCPNPRGSVGPRSSGKGPGNAGKPRGRRRP